MTSTKRRYRILIVDDDAALRQTVARHMLRLGYDVVTAESAEVALAFTERGNGQFDVVITDVHMSRMSGIELAAALLERRPAQRIVIVTGDPDETFARAAMSGGLVNCLLKPFALSELEAVVNHALPTSHIASSSNEPTP